MISAYAYISSSERGVARGYVLNKKLIQLFSLLPVNIILAELAAAGKKTLFTREICSEPKTHEF